MGLFRKAPPDPDETGPARRLHIGAGRESIPGWINIDNQGLPGVDQVGAVGLLRFLKSFAAVPHLLLKDARDRGIVKLHAFIYLRLLDRGQGHREGVLADLVSALHGVFHGIV